MTGRVTPPQELAELALKASSADDCIVLARQSNTVNLRWANNTLTTNGVTRTTDLTVISVVRSADGARV
ncbi:MAG: TldD/PmbA family protein, partial [Frankiaceae bacterium]|nr:TldD/PmbA family protein [Frankiaceae bacterium]